MAKINVSVVNPPNEPIRQVWLEVSDDAGVLFAQIRLNAADAATVGRAMVKSAAEAQIGIVIADRIVPKVGPS